MAIGINREEMHDAYEEIQHGRELVKMFREMEEHFAKRNKTSRCIIMTEHETSTEGAFESGRITGHNEVIEYLREKLDVENSYYQ